MVARASLEWIEAVTTDAPDAPKRTAALYASDGVLWGTEVHAPDDPLWGTFTEEVRDTPERIYAYYVSELDGRIGMLVRGVAFKDVVAFADQNSTQPTCEEVGTGGDVFFSAQLQYNCESCWLITAGV